MGAARSESVEASRFTSSRAHAAKVEGILEGAEMIRKPHSDVEDFLDAKGREWARLMYEEHLALRAAPERRTEVVDAEGTDPKSARDSERQPRTVLGRVPVPRLAYQARRRPAEVLNRLQEQASRRTAMLAPLVTFPSRLTRKTVTNSRRKSQMNGKSCYVLEFDPNGLAYSELIEFCCSVASGMMLVVRDPDIAPGPQIEEKRRRLERFQINVTRAKEWPGTILLADEALLLHYEVGPGLKQALQELATHLFEWIHPGAPEDLCFLRSDGTPILVTTSHERDAYLLLKDAEVREMRRVAPHVVQILRLEGQV